MHPGAELPSNARERHGVIFVGDPVAERTAAGVDVAYARALDGRSGQVRIGLDVHYGGEAGPRQAFAGGARRFTAIGANVRPGMNQALPNTAMPPAASDPVFDLLGRIPPR